MNEYKSPFKDILEKGLHEPHPASDAWEEMQKVAAEIMKQRNEIIDLFCKTFFVAQDPKSLEELKALFEICELECRVDSHMCQSFQIKLKPFYPEEQKKTGIDLAIETIQKMYKETENPYEQFSLREVLGKFLDIKEKIENNE